MIKFKNLKNTKTFFYLGGTLLLLVSVFILSQMVLAKNGNGSFIVRDSYIEVIETDYPKYISLVKKENGKEEIAGQVKIVDQYLISDLPENEFLEEYPELKSGFQDLTISLETDQPLFDKENFYYSPSLLDKTKAFFGFETLPEYRIEKEIDKSASVQTELDLKEIRMETHYQELGIENNELRIKQTLTFTDESDQALNLALLLKNQIEADKIYWNNQEYIITENARKFVNPDKVSFGRSFYDFSDVPDEFEPELWAEKKNGQNFLILSLNVSLSAGETKTIDPTYGVEITILNVHSHPQAGDNWTVSFETKGTADLTITPDDQVSIDDLVFVSLTCGEEERVPQILENDVIYYPSWFCEGTGEVIHLVNVARPHTLKFQFDDEIAYAYNNPDEVPDSFDNENYIFSKENLVVSGGQVYLDCIANGGACSSDGPCCSSICGTDVDSDNYFSEVLGHTGTCQTTSHPYTDCCDYEVNAYPGQATYYTTPRTTCGGYDYNCDTTITKSGCLGCGGCNFSNAVTGYDTEGCTGSTVEGWLSCTETDCYQAACGGTRPYSSNGCGAQYWWFTLADCNTRVFITAYCNPWTGACACR